MKPPAIDPEIDGYLVTREVEQLAKYGRRWLNHLIRQNKFPAPDIPGKNGATHRWRRSTIKKHLDSMGQYEQLGFKLD